MHVYMYMYMYIYVPHSFFTSIGLLIMILLNSEIFIGLLMNTVYTSPKAHSRLGTQLRVHQFHSGTPLNVDTPACNKDTRYMYHTYPLLYCIVYSPKMKSHC